MLEIGCEEIPARQIDPSLEQLQQLFPKRLSEHQLSFGQIQTFATPRRLIVAIDQLVDRQPDRTELILGPPASVAFTAEKTPTRAAEGFAKKHDLAVSDLRCVETGKGQYLGFDKTILGKASSEILPQIVLSIITELEFSKRMKWEETQFLFIRPIRWILCLLGGEIVPLSLAGVASSMRTFGHRVLTQDSVIEVNNFEDYKIGLLKLNVQIDPKARHKTISSLLETTASQNEGGLVRDEALLGTVVHLNEWPSVICGRFDSSYLRLPREVLVTVMREHQKYFSIEDHQGRLLPRFLAVVDADQAHHSLIARGHERVLKARLADASFFWDADVKVQLESRVDKLKKTIFQERLGTLYDKTKRVGFLAEVAARSAKKLDLLQDVADAARLCKVDLTTEMVKEFTNLQGVMGGLYAKAQHMSEKVADAIYDHYRPTTLEDESPRNSVGAILSFSDKLDSVIAAFSIGLVPTGSRDPLALRRQTLGLIKVLLDHKLSLSLKKMSLKAYSILKRKRLAEQSFEQTYFEFERFFKDRLKFIFKEQGFRYDEINAIVDVDSDNPLDCLERLRALSAIRSSPDFYSLAVSFKRIKNIILKAGLDIHGPFSVNAETFQVDEERVLHAKIQSTLPAITRARKQRAYQRTFELMASLRPQVDLFFDKVLVMAENPAVQANRLGLLGTLLVIFRNTADISEIVVN
jgi:glycyl-tRNA synthetase beta chain